MVSRMETTVNESLDKALKEAEAKAVEAIAGCADTKALDQLKPEILGKKSPIRENMRRLGELPPEEKPAAGQAINACLQRVEAAFDGRYTEVAAAELSKRLEQ